ncbi:MAG: SAM-dependent methyltransferase [Trichodesmium sp. St16_bin4-tuft]|nr:SAM-dependent methyltransferase [Trichodesmium sp. St4_bin8_1]MDE5073990.1 SAM-dependent methyltransferase [Trichodesmium sp. St5_bin8]MDE5079427.1 SAM-dependent methyltransferase [Trichodesmium sp. St2_bin6]MDE5097059.1 SAM-dependent methyltransferase [Trichodesmium sp. St16_bin4-tuft]MDE5102187.1 SAM-dependent methyltransferase [Trichodesmium sp. St19_bin2]
MNQPQLTISNNNENLCTIIYKRISESQNKRITFAEYMDLVLYHPQYGYYATYPVNIGKQGDFLTSPHWGSDFGELLAEQFLQMWHIFQKPNNFTIVEMGAGQGILAEQILGYLKQKHLDFFQKIEYLIVEKSEVLKVQQKQMLQSYQVRWSDWDKISHSSITGCFFSNELVDAFPVHKFRIEEREIREIYVSSNSQGKFVEITDKISTPEIAEYFNLVDIDLLSFVDVEGYQSEVNLQALDWIKIVSNKLLKGYLLTIDYGYQAVRYYNPVRKEGTLQCYYQHHRNNDPYWNVGRQDITAHVDFTALEKQGNLSELEILGFTKQGLFLMALGLGNRLNELSNNQVFSVEEVFRRREALHSLIDPIGLGNFGVLVQGKSLSEEEKKQTLKGFSMPPIG